MVPLEFDARLRVSKPRDYRKLTLVFFAALVIFGIVAWAVRA